MKNAAKYLRVKSPIPYKWRKVGLGQLKYGMNFAYGGTGVFNTFVMSPNMSTQIDFLRQLIVESTYTSQDLQSSVALISLAGNDYSVYQATNGSAEVCPNSRCPVFYFCSYIDFKMHHSISTRTIVIRKWYIFIGNEFEP